MTLVALMTQPLRASHLEAYVRSVDAGAAVVVISSHDATFADPNLRDQVQVRPASLSRKTLRSRSSNSGGMRRRVIRWARGGSRTGMKFDQVMRSAQRRLRYLDRLVPGKRVRRSQARAVSEMQRTVEHALESTNGENPITRIVIFDVFDLPAALSFARPRDIPVEVR